jgi:rhomboid protease GluP
MSEDSPQIEERVPLKPIRVKIPRRKPIVTFTLITVTALIFVLQYLLSMISDVDLFFFYGGKINQFIMEGQVWRLITPVFLHSSILHIVLNMYALYIIGRRLELYYGHGRFLLLYFLSAFAGNVFSFVLTPAPSLGASTAIFGLLAAEGMFIFQNRKLFGSDHTRRAIINLGVILIINLAYGFSSLARIDNMGHIGGLLGGIFFAWKGGPILSVTGQPPFFDVFDIRKKSDIVLASLVVIIGFGVIALIPFIIN